MTDESGALDPVQEDHVSAWIKEYQDDLWRHAMIYIEAGLTFIPLLLDSKTPAIQWADRQDKETTEDEVLSWLEGVPDGKGGLTKVFGWGVLTGAKSGIVVVDCDNQEAVSYAIGEAGLFSLLSVQTTRGMHMYFRHPGTRVTNKVGGQGLDWPEVPGLDLRGDGGYVVAPPTVKFGDDGKIKHRYRFNCPEGEIVGFIQTAPVWSGMKRRAYAATVSADQWSFDNLSLAAVKTYGATVWDNMADRVKQLGHKLRDGDGRNAWMTRYIGECISSDMEDAQARDAGHAFEAEFYDDPLPLEEFEAILASIINTDKRNHPEKYQKLEAYNNKTPERQGRANALRLITPKNLAELKKRTAGRKYLIDPYVAPQSIVQVVGFNGHGKSLWLLNMLWAAARGESYAGAHVDAPVKTLYLDFESSDATLTARCTDLEDSIGPMSEDMTLWCSSVVGDDMNLTTAEGLTEFGLLMNEVKPQLVVIDTVRQAWAGMEENAPAAWQKVNQLALACRNAGSSVIMVHHRNKPNMNGHGREAGSTAQLKDLDTQIFVTKVVEDKDQAQREAAIPDVATLVEAFNGASMTAWKYLQAMAGTDHKLKMVFQISFGKLRQSTDNHTLSYVGMAQSTTTGQWKPVGTMSPRQKAKRLHQLGKSPMEIASHIHVPISTINNWVS